MKQNQPALSFIIPVYNVAPYLACCIESVLRLDILDYEVILINDGSTDNSGEIVEVYAEKDKRIQVHHQLNAGLSCTRNTGIALAKGEYIAFIDSDDWLIGNQILEMFDIAVQKQVDMIKGNALFYFENGEITNSFSPVPKHLLGKVLNGKYCFAQLMMHNAYPPMVYNYIYRREWLLAHQLHFEDILHEDELWTLKALCLAERVIATDIDIYGYRQHGNSIMSSLKKEKRICDLISIADRLIDFSSRYDFSGEDNELKSQIYVKIFWLYRTAFSLTGRIRDTRFNLPSHHLYCIFGLLQKLSPDARNKCILLYQAARIGLREYLRWRSSIWTKHNQPALSNKKAHKIILIYNPIWEIIDNMSCCDTTGEYIFTTDRRYMDYADLVAFHLPTLIQEMEEDLNKQDGQLWAICTIDGDESYSFFEDEEFMELFDFKISYNQIPFILQMI